MTNAVVIVFIFVTVLMILKASLVTYERYTTYLDHKTKCFDCEKDVISRCGPKYAWMAQPAKSFDAEFEAIQQTGDDPSAGFLAKTLKYY